jgi:hypothetical protein
MLDKDQRILYFLFGCITVRTIIAILPIYLPYEWLYYLGIIILAIGTTFLCLYFNNLRLQAPEGGGITWWANFRLLHGALYLAAAHYLLKNQRIAWIPLTMDVILGLLLFLFNHKIIKFT